MTIVVYGVGALVVLMLVAALAVPVARRADMPLPVILALFGLGYGVAGSIFGLDLGGGVLDSYDMWFVDQLALDPGTMLTVLLPPLLFEMALAVNVRRLLDDLPIVLVMAVLAVIAATAAVGLALWGLSGIGLMACLLLGAAVATTDPGAVVTTFREIGAPRRLLAILEGESLLNDAAAIAAFALLAGALAGGLAPGAGSLAGGFLHAFGVGAAVGLAIAFAARGIYPWLARSAEAETSVTLAVAYGAYLAAEQGFGASGVVAVVFAGLATGSGGFVRMGPGNWGRVRAFWEQVGFWANAIILPLAASLVPGLIRDLGWAQAALILAIYGAALLARAAVLFGLLPLLDRLRLSAPMSRAQKALVLWGGVRGGVTLVLALTMAEMPALGEQARVLAGLAAGYAVLTLMLNASTLALATRLLGLDRLSPADIALRERIVAGSIDRVRSVVADLARARDLEPEALATVELALGQQAAEHQATEGTHIPFGERLRLGLAILCGQEARLIRRAFEAGAIGPRATTALRLTAERIADATRTGGREGYCRAALAAAGPSRGYRLAVLLHRRLGIDGPLARATELHLTMLLETEPILRDLGQFAETVLTPMIGADASANLAGALAARAAAIEAEYAAVSAQYPVYARDLERRLIARAAIRREREQYRKLFADGVIGPELYQDLTRDLDARERAVARPPRLDLSLSPDALIERVPLFAALDAVERRRLARLLRTRFTVPGEQVLGRGERGNAMFFVASGSLRVEGEDGEAMLGSGQFFGEIALFAPMRRRRSAVRSMGYCRLLVLGRRDFARLARRNPEIERHLRAIAARTPGAAGALPSGGSPP